MKKTILFLAVICFINYTSAQELKERYYNIVKQNLKETGMVDKDGLPTGEWKYYTEEGMLKHAINWDIHFAKAYYPTGELKETYTFIPETGVHIGEWIIYNKNGTIKSKALYDKHGVKVNG